MSAKKLPTISPSGSEESDADELTEVIEEKKPRGVLSLSETRDEILSKVMIQIYHFLYFLQEMNYLRCFLTGANFSESRSKE